MQKSTLIPNFSINMRKLPIARNSNVVVQNLNNEVLIYDLATNKVYNLNETSSLIYNACDGKTSFAELNKKHNFTDELIFLALDQLKKENLVEQLEEYKSPFSGMSRREVIRKIGLSSLIALPVITSLVAPRAAEAQSNCPSISPCNNAVTIPTGCPCSLNCSNCAGACNTITGRCV